MPFKEVFITGANVSHELEESLVQINEFPVFEYSVQIKDSKIPTIKRVDLSRGKQKYHRFSVHVTSTQSNAEMGGGEEGFYHSNQMHFSYFFIHLG